MARKSLSIVEQRVAIRKLLKVVTTNHPSKYANQEKNIGYREVAKRIGCNHTWISQIMEIDK